MSRRCPRTHVVINPRLTSRRSVARRLLLTRRPAVRRMMGGHLTLSVRNWYWLRGGGHMVHHGSIHVRVGRWWSWWCGRCRGRWWWGWITGNVTILNHVLAQEAMFDTIMSHRHLMSLGLIIALWALERRLGVCRNILAQSRTIVAITKMVVQGVLVEEELWADLAIMGDLWNLSWDSASHFLSDKRYHNPGQRW